MTRAEGTKGMASNGGLPNSCAECLRIAHENQTHRNRAVLLRMAGIWNRMADRAEAGSADEIDLSLAEQEDARGTEGS